MISREAAAALMCKLGCLTELLQSNARAKVPTALKIYACTHTHKNRSKIQGILHYSIVPHLSVGFIACIYEITGRKDESLPIIAKNETNELCSNSNIILFQLNSTKSVEIFVWSIISLL